MVLIVSTTIESEVGKVKEECKKDFDRVQDRINNTEKSFADIGMKHAVAKEDNVIIIKRLKPQTENETQDLLPNVERSTTN